MNPKYYPRLREGSELAAEVLPQLRVKVAAARKVEDLIVPVFNALDDRGIDDKDTVREVAMLLFNGMYIEVNNHYRKISC